MRAITGPPPLLLLGARHPKNRTGQAAKTIENHGGQAAKTMGTGQAAKNHGGQASEEERGSGTSPAGEASWAAAGIRGPRRGVLDPSEFKQAMLPHRSPSIVGKGRWVQLDRPRDRRSSSWGGVQLVDRSAARSFVVDRFLFIYGLLLPPPPSNRCVLGSQRLSD